MDIMVSHTSKLQWHFDVVMRLADCDGVNNNAVPSYNFIGSREQAPWCQSQPRSGSASDEGRSQQDRCDQSKDSTRLL